MLKRFTVIYDPNSDELVRVHATGCPDIAKREVPAYKAGTVSCVQEVEAESGKAAVEFELNSDFSDSSEHPATAKYPGGSYGAAGFTGRCLPCCKNAKVIA